MYSDDDYIEKLYSKKFENLNSKTSEEEWNLLDVKLRKINFLKFSFTSFNVFYLAVFMSFAGMASYFGVTSYLQSKKIEALENNIEILRKQADKIEITPASKDAIDPEKQQHKNEIVPNSKDIVFTEKQDMAKRKTESNAISTSGKTGISQSTSLSKQNVSEMLSTQTIKPDSLCKKPDSITVIKPESQIFKRVKKTVYIKQNNVVIKDTLVIKKKQ